MDKIIKIIISVVLVIFSFVNLMQSQGKWGNEDQYKLATANSITKSIEIVANLLEGANSSFEELDAIIENVHNIKSDSLTLKKEITSKRKNSVSFAIIILSLIQLISCFAAFYRRRGQ